MLTHYLSKIGEDIFDWSQGILIFICVPFFLFPNREILIFIVLAIFFLFIIKAYLFKQILNATLFDIPILILCIQIFISCLNYRVNETGFSKIIGIIGNIILFYTLSSLLKKNNIIKIGIIGFSIAGILFAIFSFLGMAAIKEKYLNLLTSIRELLPYISFKLSGAEEGFHPNAVGGTIIVILPLWISLLFYLFWINRHKKKTIKEKAIILSTMGVVLLLILILLLTQSRGSWIGISASLIIIISILFGGRIKFKVILLIIGVSGITLVAAYYLLINRGEMTNVVMELIDKAARRTHIWNVGIEAIIDNPITGVGINQIRFNPKMVYSMSHVHNHYIQTAAELGLPALIAILVILVNIIKTILFLSNKKKYDLAVISAFGLIWGQFAHAIFGLSDSIPLGAKPGIILWVSLAIINAIYAKVIMENEKNVIDNKK